MVYFIYLGKLCEVLGVVVSLKVKSQDGGRANVVISDRFYGSSQ